MKSNIPTGKPPGAPHSDNHHLPTDNTSVQESNDRTKKPNITPGAQKELMNKTVNF